MRERFLRGERDDWIPSAPSRHAGIGSASLLLARVKRTGLASSYEQKMTRNKKKEISIK